MHLPSEHIMAPKREINFAPLPQNVPFPKPSLKTYSATRDTSSDFR